MRMHSASRLTTSVNNKRPLANGDHMKQPEFHRRYEQCPKGEKWELVGGIVYMPSPLSVTHSDYQEEIGYALSVYRRSTPGVQALQGATTILGDKSEPQPDLSLRIRPEYRGRSQTVKDYVKGPPELLVEIAHSTRALDLLQKRADYERAGVLEYVVVSTEEPELHWFNLRTDRPLRPDREGVYRSKVFPGLWIDGPALLRLDSTRVEEVVRQGLASSAHAAFVRRLERSRRKPS
jgi:Uma2 family endonuclease